MPKVGTIAYPRRSEAPVVFIYIDGKPADDLVRRLLSFQYKKTIKKASETKMRFQNPTAGDFGNHIPLAEDRRFLANSVWQFRFGYFGNISPIHTGILRQIEPVYADKREISITLFDHSSKLGKSSSSKNWGRVASSEIAEAIAKKYNLQVVTEDSNDVPEKSFIQPSVINDLMFLRDLAADINFEFFVHDSPPTLVYRSTQYDYPPAGQFTFAPGDGGIVKSFKPKIKSLGEVKTQASKASGRKKGGGKGKGSESSTSGKGALYSEGIGSRNAPEPNAIFGEYGTGEQQIAFIEPRSGDHVYVSRDVADTLYNSVPGATVVYDGIVVKATNIGEERAFNQRARAHATASGANTRRVAQAKRQQLLDKAEEASSSHPLIPDLVIGVPYVWDGLDAPFNRNWYASEATHTITGTSVETTVNWKRDDPKAAKGSGKGGAKPKAQPRVETGADTFNTVVIEARAQTTVPANPPVAVSTPPKRRFSVLAGF